MSDTAKAADGVYLFPASFAQQRLLVLDQMGQGGYSYNVYRTIHLNGDLNAGALARALNALVERHESLRTHFTLHDDNYMQVVAESQFINLSIIDLSDKTAAECEAEIESLIGEQAYRPFDLLQGPLFRVQLLKRSRQEHLLLLNMHHVISDGWSMDVLLRDLSLLYNAYESGAESPLPELPIQYADYSVWQRDYLQSEVLDEQLRYWKTRLNGASATLELPTDRARPARRTNKGTAYTFTLQPDLSETLKQFSIREGVTMYTTLLTGFLIALSRWSGQEDVVIGTPLAGRTRSEVENLIGFFVNVLPIRVDVAGHLSFRELLERVRQASLEAYAHQDVPFDLVVKELQPERNLSHSPIYQITFQFQNSGEGLTLTNLDTSVRRHRSESSKLDFALSLVARESGIGGSIEYSTELFDASTIRRMVAQFQTLLRRALSEPDRAVKRLPLLSDENLQQLVCTWNETQDESDAHRRLHELFEDQVTQTPDATAVVCKEEKLTYRELNERANRVAHWLIAQGAGPESIVGILQDRCASLVISVLAVLKAGAAYLPLDPEQPGERLSFMLEDAGASIMLTTAEFFDLVPVYWGQALFMDQEAELSGFGEENPGVATGGENLAYVIYTSGSTGQPKGVMISHQAVSNYVTWAKKAYGVMAGEGVPVHSSLGFDLTVTSIYTPLVSGGWVKLLGDGDRRLGAVNELREALTREGEYGLVKLTPAHLEVLRRNVNGDDLGRASRCLVVGGEQLRSETALWWQRRAPQVRIYNEYGPTEATVGCCVQEFAIAENEGKDTVAIGRPIANTRLYVLDSEHQPVGIGMTGELYIGGSGVARGYLGRADLTAERFIPDGLSGVAGARLYCSGDLARYRADGVLECLGRNDQQVKLRGYRLELGEIEATLRALDGVRDSVVLVKDAENGDKRLVAYVARDPRQEITISELRDQLREKLPEYMVPGHFVVLDEFPLTANGKIDHARLPEAIPERSEESYVAPRTAVEEILAGVWREVLAIEQVGINDNFFNLGGHSLLAILLAGRVLDMFGVEIPLNSIFDQPTVAELAIVIEKARAEGETSQLPPLAAGTRPELLPLSFAQQRLWFIAQMEPGNPLYNIPGSIRINGELNLKALEQAISDLIRRHEPLRTTFRSISGSPVQVIGHAENVGLRIEDLGHLTKAQSETEAVAIAMAEAKQPFDLAHGPVVRFRLLRLSDQTHVLLFTMHHIISDAWSMKVFLGELSSLYNSYLTGQPLTLPDLPVQYADYALWQRQCLRDEVLERQLSYWKQQMAGAAPVIELPTDHPRPPVQSYSGGRRSFKLPKALSAQLAELSQRENVTLYMTLLAAFQLLLARCSRQEDIVVGTPMAGRSRPEVENLIGFFVNTLVMRGDLSGNPHFIELLRRTRAVCLGAYAHQDIPFEKLVEDLQPARSLSYHPLFQVMFQLQSGASEQLSLSGTTVQLAMTQGQTAKFDLMLGMKETPEGLVGSWSYNADLFEETTIDRLATHFQNLLASIVAAPESAVDQLRLLDETERAQLLYGWNETSREFPAACIHELFEQQVEQSPEAVAVVFDEVRLTYRELNDRANQLAHYLRRQDVGPESVVAILLERSVELVVAFLGTLKAGAAYLPLDPGYPEDRLWLMIRETKAAVLLTESSLRPKVPTAAQTHVVCVETWSEELATESRDAVESGVCSENLAYVMYTSGSTGHPKGVAVTHRSVVRLVKEAAYASFTTADVFLQLASISFDAATFEIWGPLLNGARLVLFAGSEPTLEELGDTLRRHEVTTLWLTAGLFHLMVDERLQDLEGVRQLLAGGDVLSLPHVKKAAQHLSRCRVINGYGPTENTTFTCCYHVDDWTSLQHTVPIGRPISNTQVYLLDAVLQPVPVGVAGEVYIGGAGLARGYWESADLTAERFVPNPFGRSAGERLYRTGDLACYQEDGNVQFRGRVDQQVKIRGFRIELGEIEAALCRQSQVREAIVVAKGQSASEKQLVGYIVPEADAELDLAGVQAELRRQLPEYMVPARFVVMDELPLTANGKVDRDRLPEPGLTTTGAYTAPQTLVQEILCSIWAEVLKIDRIGIYDNFFELGGHSLLAVAMTARVKDTLNIDLPLRELFKQPTVAELAGVVEDLRASGRKSQVPPLKRRSKTEAAPLSFAQHRLWFIDQMEPGPSLYNMPAAYVLEGKLNHDALEAALTELVRRHESLRTSFQVVGKEAVQVVAPPEPVELFIVDLSQLNGAERDEAVRREGEEEARQPFNLATGPVFRARLLKVSDEEHVLLLTLHHIVADSLVMVVNELAVLYNAYHTEQEPSLEELTVQYTDYSIWQCEFLQGEILDEQLEYWKQQLSGAPEILELPTDRPRPAIQSYEGAVERFVLPEQLSADLKALSQREGSTLFMTLLAAFKLLLSRYSGQSDVVVGTPISGRSLKETENLIGLFINTLAIRTNLTGCQSFRQLLAEVRANCLGAYEHAELPFEKLVQELQPERSLSHQPIFQTFFSMLFSKGVSNHWEGLSLRTLNSSTRTTKFDISVTVGEIGSTISGAIEYSSSLFDATTIRRLIQHFENLLRAVVADSSQSIATIPFLSATEHRQLAHEWNGTAKEYPRVESIVQLFEQQVERAPDATAIRNGDEALTYAELNQRANSLARHLQQRQIRPEMLAGICMERGIDIVIAMLAVLKSGAAYVPIDPSLPVERINFLLKHTEASVVLTTEQHHELLPVTESCEVIVLDNGAEALAGYSDANLPCAVTGQNLAYVMYTSGSTGKPKGVAITHDNLGWLAHNLDQLEIRPGDVVAFASHPSFDAVVYEVWGALTHGARIEVIGRETMLSPVDFGRQLRESGVSILYLTAAVFTQLASQDATIFSSVRTMVSGGESIANNWARQVLQQGPPRQLIHEYGPTETTVFSSIQVVKQVAAGERNLPIGRPLSNTKSYILDAEMQLAPIGVVGELYIGGDCVGRGYWRAPEQTAERFVPNPLSSVSGERLYRTGDMVRYGPTGELEFIGRKDQQVKLRGMRIELGEIETVLGDHPQIQAARVLVYREGAADRLIAYVVADAKRLIEKDARNYLRERLPDYMVPSAVMLLESMPLTANGKVDQRALPRPEKGRRDEEGYVAPAMAIEEMLCDLWMDVLKLDRVGVHDHFFEIGGHSLLAAVTMGRIRELFKVELSLRNIFEHPTIAALAVKIEEVLRSGAALEQPPLLKASRTEPLPLSFAQQRLWLIDQMEPGSPAYNIPLAKRLEGPLNVPVLERVLNEILRRHESLRTTFRIIDGEARQVFADATPLQLNVVDLSDDAEAEAAAQRRANEEARKPFDLVQGPLFRTCLLKLAEHRHVLLLTLHHIVSDGWSMDLLFRELSVLYNAYARGEETSLAEPEVQYADYAVWQREWLTGEVLERQLAYWKQQLDAVEVLELPTDRPRPAIQSFKGATERFRLPESITAKLKDLSQREGVTLFMTLLAAFQALLSRYSGQEEVLVGTPIQGRNRVEFEPLIGFFVNTLVLRGDLRDRPTFLQLLARTREACLGAYAHQDIPFDKLVEEIRPQRTLSHQPLCQVLFQVLNENGGAISFDGLTINSLQSRSRTTKCDLSFSIAQSGNTLHGAMEYSTDLFDGETIRRLLEHFAILLEAAIADPEKQIAELSLTAESERTQLLYEWNQTATVFPREQSLIDLFEAQVAATPDVVAIVHEAGTLSYYELNQRANRLARHLLKRGVRRGDLVAILLERSPEMVIALLAALKTGGAYLPLDPAHPSERLRLMLEDAGAPVLVTQGNGLRDCSARLIQLDVELAEIERESSANLPRQAWPESIAYVIYTSGSTGTPKGIVIPQRAVVRLVKNTNYIALGPDDRIAQASNSSFDAATFEMWGALLNGAQLIIIPRDSVLSPHALATELNERGVTTMFLTTALFNHLARETATQLGSLKHLLFGGELVDPESVAQVLEKGAPERLLHVYGPTESTTFATWHCITAVSKEPRTIPIGQPLANTTAYILDEQLEPAPVGVPAELYLGGDGLAYGYFNRPEMTAEKFIPDPFAHTQGQRLYKTGDWARYRRDGAIEFLGRRDQQVKVRGFRIELGEIEAALCAHSQVRKAVVVALDQGDGDKRLAAYLVKEGEGELNDRELCAYLSQRLPEYMAPSAFVWLDDLPLTTNGKVDRQALPEPRWEKQGVAGEHVEPRTPLEETLAHIWCEVLKRERIGIHDDFFELGGHSLLAMLATTRIREVFQWDLPLHAFFQNATIAKLSEHLETQAVAAGVDIGAMARLLVELNGLSEAEVQTMLSEREVVPV